MRPARPAPSQASQTAPGTAAGSSSPPDAGRGLDRDGLVVTTDAHSFWAPELARWVDAVDLEPGTWLRTSAGTWAQVSAVTVRTAENQRVHNPTVDGLHTYHVAAGNADLPVHNDSVGGPCPEAEAIAEHANERFDGEPRTTTSEAFPTPNSRGTSMTSSTRRSRAWRYGLRNGRTAYWARRGESSSSRMRARLTAAPCSLPLKGERISRNWSSGPAVEEEHTTVLLTRGGFSLLYRLAAETENMAGYRFLTSPAQTALGRLREVRGPLRGVREQLRHSQDSHPSPPPGGGEEAVRLVRLDADSVLLSLPTAVLDGILAGAVAVRDGLGDSELQTRTGFSPAEFDTLLTCLEAGGP